MLAFLICLQNPTWTCYLPLCFHFLLLFSLTFLKTHWPSYFSNTLCMFYLRAFALSFSLCLEHISPRYLCSWFTTFSPSTICLSAFFSKRSFQTIFEKTATLTEAFSFPCPYLFFSIALITLQYTIYLLVFFVVSVSSQYDVESIVAEFFFQFCSLLYL